MAISPYPTETSVHSLPPALDPTRQPPSSSTDLVLVPATPAEHEQATYVNADEWRGALTVPQYIEREKFLMKQDLTKNSQITPWILTSRGLDPNADGTRPILAACETFLKTAYVARDGNIEEVLTHGVGSVYTASEYRGKGYAARMMTELAKRLETWQQKNGHKGMFSVLFSDIGQKFYLRFGWKAFLSTHINLECLNEEQYQQLQRSLPAVRDLEAVDIDAIPATEWMQETLRQMSKLHPGTPYVAIRPDVQHFAWHHAREEFQSGYLDKPFPQIKGAVHEPSGMAIIWTRVYTEDAKDYQLHVLHIAMPPQARSNPTQDTEIVIASLILRAQREADASGMVSGVEIWDPSQLIIDAASRLRKKEQGKVEVIIREKEHISSLRWLGAQPGDNPGVDPVWIGNEKYAWC